MDFVSFYHLVLVCMDIPTAMTDVNDVISAIGECQLNTNNLGHEWNSRNYDCQTLLDATGDYTSDDNYSLPRQHPTRYTATIRPQNIFDFVHHLSAK